MRRDAITSNGRGALGVTTAADVGPETLGGLLRAEAAADDAALLGPLMVGAWARVT